MKFKVTYTERICCCVCEANRAGDKRGHGSPGCEMEGVWQGLAMVYMYSMYCTSYIFIAFTALIYKQRPLKMAVDCSNS